MCNLVSADPIMGSPGSGLPNLAKLHPPLPWASLIKAEVIHRAGALGGLLCGPPLLSVTGNWASSNNRQHMCAFYHVFHLLLPFQNNHTQLIIQNDYQFISNMKSNQNYTMLQELYNNDIVVAHNDITLT